MSIENKEKSNLFEQPQRLISSQIEVALWQIVNAEDEYANTIRDQIGLLITSNRDLWQKIIKSHTYGQSLIKGLRINNVYKLATDSDQNHSHPQRVEVENRAFFISNVGEINVIDIENNELHSLREGSQRPATTDELITNKERIIKTIGISLFEAETMYRPEASNTEEINEL